MYRIKTIEKAILLRGYSIDEFFIRRGFVKKVEGKVNDKKVLWDATGHCFLREGNIPLPQHNLRLSDMYIDVDSRGIASIHNLYREDLEQILKAYDNDSFGEKIRTISEQVKEKTTL